MFGIPVWGLVVIAIVIPLVIGWAWSRFMTHVKDMEESCLDAPDGPRNKA